MREEKYREIVLSRISSNPDNPRAKIAGPNFDELVASVREKGIIEPIIVRPKPVPLDMYEVVAGERRFKAACLVAEENEGLDKYKIPAIVRELSDEEAFDFMIIENLQREDLTPYEEAQSFKRYFDKKGKGSVPELAARIGKSAGYIRRKIAVLSLPRYVLKSWEKDELTFSHLEQLRRLKNKRELKEVFDYATGKPWRDSVVSKRELKEHIDNLAPPLKSALFDIEKEGCLTCGQNSEVQQELWEVGGMKGAHCLDRKCFKQKQNNFLVSNWQGSAPQKRCGTNGFRFQENVSWNDHESFSSWGLQPVKKCRSCPDFLTILTELGEVKVKQACFNLSCYKARERERRRGERIDKDPDAPRVEWHGVYFREEFFKKRLPKKIKEVEASDIKIARLALFCFAKLDWSLYSWIAKQMGVKGCDHYENDDRVFNPIAKMELEEIQEYLKKLSLKVLMDATEMNVKGRRAAAEHFGIDLSKEWFVTREYLEKKTIKEMLAFGEKSGIFKDKKVQEYLTKTLKKKPGKFSSCKKTELIDLFLKSGMDLVGKVPDEILKK